MATRSRIGWLLLLALLGAGVACSDEGDDETPPDTGGFGRRDAGDEVEEDAETDEVDAGTGDAGDEDTDTASEKEAKAKGWRVGCYKKPKTNEELLNSCAGGFREFDKTWYPSDWQPGKLPTPP